MMEVDQPLKENGLPKMSPTVECAESLQSTTAEVVHQNGMKLAIKDGLSVVTKVVPSAADTARDSDEAKGLEDDESMERLMYTDLDDGDDEDLQAASANKAPAEESELAQNLSDTLIEDIIQLNKDSKRAEPKPTVDPDRLESEDSSDISPSSGQSSNQTAAEQADAEDTNGAISNTVDDALNGVNGDLAAEVATKEVADIEEDCESILLQEDNVELEDDLEVDERLLLDEDVDMEEAASAILIDDSVLASAGETIEGTDASVTIDESGLSILNTAAVDIADITADVSEEASLEPQVEDVVNSAADNPLVTDEPKDIPEDMAPLSPDISDLIKFPDMEKIASKPESSGESTEQKEVIPEASELIKCPDDIEAETKTEMSLSRPATPEVSDLIKFDSITEVVEAQHKDAPTEKEVVEANDNVPEVKGSTVKVVKEDAKSAETNETEALQEDKVPAEKLKQGSEQNKVETVVKKDSEEKLGPDEEPAAEEDDTESAQHTCRQALQAADEEDLLEMMEEPDQIEGDEEPEPEEDLDDNSSESGSNKPVEGDEEDDFEGSDYMGGDEDESSRTAEEQEEPAGEEIQVEEDELADGEPPLKRKCSVDVREAPEEESDKNIVEEQQKVEEAKDSIVEKKNEEIVEEKVEAKETAKSPKVDEVSEEKSETEKKIESENCEEKSVVEVKEKIVSEVVPSVAEEPKNMDDKVIGEELKDDKADVKTEKESMEMDISQEESVEPKEVEEETSAETKNIVEAEKKVQAVEKLEKEDSDISEKPEPLPADKDDETVKEDIKQPDKESEVKADPKEEQTPACVAETQQPVEDNDKKPEVKEQMSSDAPPDEVFLIDDDDDEIADIKIEVADEKKAEKRPCPDDDVEGKVDLESTKKIRLSVEQKEEVKPEEPKEETKVEVVEEKKSALELMEPLKTVLKPEPVVPKEKKAIRLEFLDKFKKPLERMNRPNLEDFVLQKIVEGIAFKSAIAEMRTQLDAQDTLLQGYRQKVHDLNKQFRDLEMVHERVVKDLEKKNQHFITPVKITRAVGLQVSQPRFVAGCRPTGSNATATGASPKGAVVRSPVSTPTGGSPNKNSPQLVQNRRPAFSRIAPANMAQKPAAQQSVAARPGPPIVINKTLTSPQSTILLKTTTVQGQVTPINSTQQVQTILSASLSQPTTAAAAASLARKKPLQKYTPMRPPLSITQQVQQQQQTRQMQEQLMRQQIQDVQTSNGGQSPQTQSPQGSPLTRTPEPASSPGPVSRVSTMVMKKVAPQPQAKPATTNAVINRQNPSMVSSPAATQARSAPSTPTTPTAPAVDNSLIDLTDEDDVPKPAPIPVATPTTTATTVVPKPPITILNGQQQQQQQQQFTTQRQPGMPPLVVINQQRMMTRPALQQRPAGMVNGAPPRPVLMQRPTNATNGFPRAQTYRARMINGQLGNTRNMIARPPIRQQPAASFTHPAPLPQPGSQLLNPSWKQTPPRPSIRINNIETGIVISWTMDDLSEVHASIVSYQIYAYQETNAPPSMDMWRHVGDVKAMLLPMAVTLTQFQEGQRYHFAVRAVDEHQRVGQFSPPRTWNESTPAKA